MRARGRIAAACAMAAYAMAACGDSADEANGAPGDLWLCRSCACNDASAPDATIEAPVQGCASAGLHEASAADRAQACVEVCGGTMCGASSGCAIGACRATEGEARAELVARSTCDPMHQPGVRVTDAGDYRAVLVPELSSVTIHTSDESTTHPVNGVLSFNLVGSGPFAAVDFANAFLAGDFTVADQQLADGRIVIAERLFGNFTDDVTFAIPAGIGVFGLRDGHGLGFNVKNPAAASGTVDVPARRFTLHIETLDFAEGSDRRIDADLVADIDNVPPTADAGGPVQNEECQSSDLTSVQLDGTPSTDLDAGDSITHFQWFDDFFRGLGNTSQVAVSLPLGDSHFFLHVYDQRLGADAVAHTVRVEDTTLPALEVAPDAFCLWPPDLVRVRFQLERDVVATATDACDSTPSVRIVSVTSSEPEDDPGDESLAPDVTFGPAAFCVRRERTGLGGRTYLANFEARDSSANAAQRTVRVFVPYDPPADCASGGTVIAEDAPCE